MTDWAIQRPGFRGWLFGRRRTGGGGPMLSEKEQAVLDAVRALSLHDRDGAGTLAIQRYLRERGWRLSYGGLYVVLERLKKKGHVTYHHVPGGPERGFRRKRCYTVTRI